MENIYHEKEERGVFYGEFCYNSEGMFAGSFEAKCSQVCVNLLLQKARFIEGLAVSMDDQALSQTIASLHINSLFGLAELNEMENIFLVNWLPGQMEVFGSLLAMYQVLKAEKLSLLPLTASLHPQVSAANKEPHCARGYLYHLEDHWIVMRQMGNQWYKFDPWLDGPQLVNHFHVSLMVKQLATDGKLVFLVDGEFPKTPADDQVFEEPVSEEDEQQSLDDPGKPSLELTEQEIGESLRFLDLVFENEDNELALALLLSLEDDLRRTREMEEITRLMSNASIAPTPHQATLSSEVDPVRDLVDLVSDTTVQSQANQRRIGTTVNPLITETIHDAMFNSSSDSDDYGGPFNLIFKEPGEGSYCLSAPSPSFRQASAPPLPFELSTNCSASAPTAVTSSTTGSSSSQPVPRVFITSSDSSTFKKVLPSMIAEEEVDEETMCCICWTELPSHVVVPCGHYCLCSSCSVSIMRPPPNKSFCPLCKQETTGIIKLYK